MSSLLAAFLVAHALVPGSNSGGDAMSVLTHSFGDQITSELEGKSRVISYCPDNTCEAFSAPAGTPENALADFALTYLFYASGYTYLDTFVTRDGQAEAHSIIARNRGSCANDNQLQLASCVLLSLAQRHSIRVASVVFDEGARRETPVRLKTRLSVSQLRRTEAWRAEQWRRQS